MISSGLLYGLSPSTIGSPSKPKRLSYYPPGRNQCCNSVKCKGSSIVDYDLYELLGIDSSSNQQQIKNAYRSLQKQCHPDIAGPDGHDMSIILNEAYALLSNPNSRYVYDKEQAKMEDFRGYTGKPLYSTWFGSESEDRAVFVDEVKCVGCLKCALFAEKTFAVESVYGRARVVAQWADPDDKISDAIQSCPVDCISMVARSDLAALEFLMSKQPRGTVQMTAGNTGGKRVSNIFVDVNKFQSKYQKMRDKASGKDKEPDFQRDARVSAMQAIRSISNWWYWKSPAPNASRTQQSLIQITDKATHSNKDRLQEAAARRRAGENMPLTPKSQHNYTYSDDYWTPSLYLPTPTQNPISTTSKSIPVTPNIEKEKSNPVTDEEWENPMNSPVPLVAAAVSAVIVGFESGGRTVGGLQEHIGGSTMLDIVNSSWLQIILAGITWYLIGAAIMGFAQALGRGFRN